MGSSEMISTEMSLMTEQLKAANEELEFQKIKNDEDLKTKDELIAQLRLEMTSQREGLDRQLRERMAGTMLELEELNRQKEIGRKRILSLSRQVENERTEKSHYMSKLMKAKEAYNETIATRSITELRLKQEQEELQKAQAELKKTLSDLEIKKKIEERAKKTTSSNADMMASSKANMMASYGQMRQEIRQEKPGREVHRIEREWNRQMKLNIMQVEFDKKSKHSREDKEEVKSCIVAAIAINGKAKPPSERDLTRVRKATSKVTPKMEKKDAYTEPKVIPKRRKHRVREKEPSVVKATNEECNKKKLNLSSCIAAMFCIKGNN